MIDIDSLFHFVFPIISVLAARIKTKHIVRTSVAAAVVTVLLDIDHFIGSERGIFHNIFITILIPLIILYLSFVLKLNRFTKGFFFLLLIFLSSHVFIDMFSSPSFGDGIGLVTNQRGVALFYPFSPERYSVNFNVKIPLATSDSEMGEGYVVSSLGFGILIYFIAIIVPCLFLDDIIEISERKHEKFMKAAGAFFRRIIKD